MPSSHGDLSLDCATLQLRVAFLCLQLAAREYTRGGVGEVDEAGAKIGGRFKKKEGGSKVESPEKLSPEAQLQSEFDRATSPDQIREVLTKRVVYQSAAKLEGKQTKGFLEKNHIKVLKTFDDPATGFSAAAFDVDGMVQLTFTGTNDNTDWDNNFKGEIGRTQFDANKKDIEKFLKEQNAQGIKPAISGHSLGGALAQIVASEYPDSISSVTTYNSAGILRSTAQKIEKAQNPPIVEHYVRASDVVSSAGEAFIGGTAKYYGTLTSGHFDGTPHRTLMTLDAQPKPTPKWLEKKMEHLV